MTSIVNTHGVTERHRNGSDIERHAEEIRRVGVTVIPDVFTPNEMDQARDLLEQIYAVQVAEVGGEENLRLINDANIVRSPLAYHPFFRSVAKHPKMLSVAKACLGENVSLSSQVGIINRLGFQNYQEAWHRELQYQHFTSSRSLAVQGLLAVDEFTQDNGGTYFLHGSHLFESFPSDEFVSKWEQQCRASRGSIIIFDAMVYHRGASNRSSRARVAVNNLYTAPIIHQQFDLANMLGDRSDLDHDDRSLFGYRWRPAEDVRTWREKRILAKKANDANS
jgi:ectoine hydroxylase-related dioxygenase (phytanoyl-CoA dioxygenase family)